MIKILTIIGARPQIIKAAAISRAIRTHYADRISEIILHTGQHYDTNMSEVFFSELQIPKPHHNLQVGSGNHGAQTARMLEGIEEVILHEKPDAVLVYGDTNSTIAGGLAASKLHVPLIHVEAGLRSFNKAMPEEINRIGCDHVSTLLFSPTIQGIENLSKEGFDVNFRGPYSIDHPGVYHCGDIMYDNSLYFSTLADKRTILKELNLAPGFILSTIHRNNNTDEPERLNDIFSTLNRIATEFEEQVVLPLHPRTRKMMDNLLDAELREKLLANPRISIIPPVSFLDVIALEKHCSLIITDSGGVQKEAYFFQKPCIILRPETEWVEIVEQGAAKLADAGPDAIMSAFKYFRENSNSIAYPPIFGDGQAAVFICGEILKHLE